MTRRCGNWAPLGSGSAVRGLRLELNIVLQPHRLDHVELLLERVDMLLLILQYLGQQVAADIIADALAMLDRLAQLGQRLELQLEIGVEHLLDRLADAEPPETLEIGQALEEEDALGEL